MLRGRHNGYIIVLHRIMLGKLSYIVGVWSDKLRGPSTPSVTLSVLCAYMLMSVSVK